MPQEEIYLLNYKQCKASGVTNYKYFHLLIKGGPLMYLPGHRCLKALPYFFLNAVLLRTIETTLFSHLTHKAFMVPVLGCFALGLFMFFFRLSSFSINFLEGMALEL